MHVHGSAILMYLELLLCIGSKNNHRSIFRKWSSKKMCENQPALYQQAALVQSLWCCCESPGIETLPWNMQSRVWHEKHHIEPGTENLHTQIWIHLHGVYDPQEDQELALKCTCRQRGFLFKGTFWLLKNTIISKDKVIRQWQPIEYNQSITGYISKTDRGVKMIRYKWLYTDL